MPRKKKASMKVKAPGAKKNLDNMKYEIASELGVSVGANSSSRDNGIVGGEITKRLVEKNMNKSKSKSKSKKKKSK